MALIMLIANCKSGRDDKVSVPISGSVTDSLHFPFIRFDETEHDFGRVYEGEQVGWYFRFKNTGSKDLVLTKAYSSCGCTVPAFSRKPIPAGQEGEVKVVFDTKGRAGTQSKAVTIESNAQNKTVTLIITAEVVKK